MDINILSRQEGKIFVLFLIEIGVDDDELLHRVVSQSLI